MTEPIKTRACYKAKLTLFSKYIKEIQAQSEVIDTDIIQLNERLNKIQLLINDFDEIQNIIENTGDAEAELQERENFENNYYNLIAITKKIIRDYEKQNDDEKSSVSSKHSSRNNGHVDIASDHIKLPTIHLSKFHGDYADWLEFRDTYESLIHENTSLSIIQKFHYLRASLEGSALQVIKSLEFTSKNYTIAWNTLLERYNNNRLLVHKHVKALFSIEVVAKETAEGFRKVIDSVSKNLRALEQLGQPTENWDTLVVYIITSKLDNVVLREWEGAKAGKEIPTLNDLKAFLKARADLLEALDLNQAEKKQHRSNTKGFLVANDKHTDIKCKICNKNHYIQNCSEFLSMSNETRVDQILGLRLCLNCLRPGHISKICRSGTCKKCNRKHHTLLHNPNPRVSMSRENVSTSTTLSACVANNYVLLSTAYVEIMDAKKDTHTVRALLDSGSQSSYITDDLCKRLNLNTSKANITVLGLNQSKSNIDLECEVTISSLHNKYSAQTNCFVIPQITTNLPSVLLDVSNLKIPKNIKLADPSFFEPSKIDMLIGANLFWSILSIGQISLGSNRPVLQKTRFGWIVSGPLGKISNSSVICNFSRDIDIQNQLSKFWEVEDCSLVAPWTEDEMQSEKHFKENLERSTDGRFIVTIPFKDTLQCLGDSYEYARRRFLSLETKLENKPEFKERYTTFMNEYQTLGHMTKIQTENEDKICYYMPHHGVVKEESLTTKLRVVFDASAPTSTGISLNDIQKKGPTIQSDLFSILLRFRQYRYVVAADVEKMYRQILVQPAQQCLQRILWRESPDKHLDTFELNTVTYGTTAASFLAVRCLFELAEQNVAEYPLCADRIKSDFYMDDLLTGSDSIEEAALLARDISNILRQGQFNLRKFYANSSEILKYIATSDCHESTLTLNMHENAKTLGLTWCPASDILKYNIGKVSKIKRVTKRSILSSVSQIFDPLGLLSPCIVKAKFLLQKLWLEKVTWDEGVSMHLHTLWRDFETQLNDLKELHVSRHIVCENHTQIEMHAFSDASEKAYGGCIYIKSTGQNGNVHVNLLCAKTKVAPLKTITLPRLELLGAVIVARLADKVSAALRIKFGRRWFWCDSTIVLGWIKLLPYKLKTFVSNRVSEIQQLTSHDNWRHVPSRSNPADILTRGLMPNEMKNSELWWHGPNYLTNEECYWPSSSTSQRDVLPDMRNNVHTFTSQNVDNFPFEDFSNLNKVKRVTAWMFRFKNNCSNKGSLIKLSYLSATEINKAFEALIKLAQSQSFNGEIENLNRGTDVHKRSKILNLNPFLDEAGILRVGGRLQNSKFSKDKKHPIILSSKHRITRLIFENEHTRLLHAGPQQMLASIREAFWPIGGRNLCKQVARSCLNCFRNKPNSIQPVMGHLPEARVQPAPPFNVTGIDYAGPVLIKDRKGRGAKFTKCYIGLFICFSTKAVHLELISDLTRESFIMALRRFVSRRGSPGKIYSDNGSNFVSASSELKELAKFLVQHEQDWADYCSKEQIMWNFIPPYSPLFGGLWEAGIKKTKCHLKRVLGNAHLTFEELNTVLVQVEAILNSRPLSPLSSDPNDITPLTPAHFLIGRPLTAIPEPDLKEVSVNRLTRFQHVQQCQQYFWNRWQREYIAELQQRVKWKRTQGELKIGSMVLVKDENLPPLRWKIGRVTQLHPGKDGVSRVATIKVHNGELRRAYSKLCPLPETDQ